ncbi:MAG: helix-turn-helix domain-containing protein [Anaerolineales bacterium]
MQTERYQEIEGWTENQLFTLPPGETDYYEYKSSLIPLERLKTEICVAASAFWNTGGGLLLAGIDDHGHIDGGIPVEVGNQRLRDWVDQVLAHVEPLGPYVIKTIEADAPDSAIQPGHAVLAIGFGESHLAPHMAPDFRYYVRAGTHSSPSGHFLVEAIRARRGLQKPLLRGLLRMHPNKGNTVQLMVLVANDAAALDVELRLSPLPHKFANIEDRFPLKVPIIDRDNAFAIDFFNLYSVNKIFDRDKPVYLDLTYCDVAGRRFSDSQPLDPFRSLSTVRIGVEDADEIRRSLKQMVKQMKRLNILLENLTHLDPPKAEPDA